MEPSGYYQDPLKRHFARLYTGAGWAYKVRTEDGLEQIYFDADLTDQKLKQLEPPTDTSLIELVEFELPPEPPLREEVEPQHDQQVDSSEITPEEIDFASGDWVYGFNSRIRLMNDSIEILLEVSKKRSTLFFSSFQELNNEGIRTIPLRTIQAVHLSQAKRGIMGALQFTVPGSLTNQHRDSAGKVLRIINGLGDGLNVTNTQAHENSVSFEVSQQPLFEKFHSFILERMNLVLQPTNESSSAAPDFISQLRELKTLVDDGILTKAEFDSAKQEILRKI